MSSLSPKARYVLMNKMVKESKKYFEDRLKENDKNVVSHLGKSKSGMSGSGIRLAELINKNIIIKGNTITINAKKIIEGAK